MRGRIEEKGKGQLGMHLYGWEWEERKTKVRAVDTGSHPVPPSVLLMDAVTMSLFMEPRTSLLGPRSAFGSAWVKKKVSLIHTHKNVCFYQQL